MHLVIFLGFLILASTEHCILPKQASSGGINLQWLTRPHIIYTHFAGSISGLKRYAELIASEQPASKDKLEDVICLHESFKSTNNTEKGKTIEWIQIGFGTQGIHRSCDSDLSQCRFTTQTSILAAKLNASKQAITLTDNDSYLIIVECWEDGLKSWHALTPLTFGKPLNQETKDLILDHVKGIGFNVSENEVYFAKYDKCTDYFN